MKILHLTWGLGIGGLETMLSDIAIEQAAAHDIWLVVGNRDVDTSITQGLDRCVRLVTLGRPAGSPNPWYLIKLILWLWWINPDIVHAHQDSFSRLRKLIWAPMVLTVHATRTPLSEDLAAYDSVCCISDAVRDDVVSRFPGCHPQVIHNGIDCKTVRCKVRYGGSPFRIVQVGRLAHDIKGQDLLIQASRLLLDRLGAAAFSVDFIGAGESLDYLQRLASDYGVEDQCRFSGAAPRRLIYDELCDYDLLVQPSRYEGFGLTVIEGIAAGLPVLVSDIEGPKEIIANGELGWCFKSEDTQDLANKITELITMSSESDFAGRMRTRAELARSRFDIRLTAQRYMEEYARLSLETPTVRLRA